MNQSHVPVLDYEPTADDLGEDVLQGLGTNPKTLPCKYLYDERGCSLFEQICELDEYYLTRTEVAIMEGCSHEMADAIGPGCMLIEFGSGSSTKTRLLLDQLHDPVAYVPVDIARQHLEDSAIRLARQYPELEVLPVCADFTTDFTPPEASRDERRRVVYFPGSTIGNFDRPDATELLKRIARLVGPSGGFLVGLDLRKDESVLEAAYNDSEGVTAEFNLNLLARLNRELGADFELERFEHRASYNADAGRIEIDIVSLEDQTVSVLGRDIEFGALETIRTEHSHKYRLSGFAEMARQAGFAERAAWTDPERYFAVAFYEQTRDSG